ncbi:TPA: hypothetical protein ACH3X2_014027 [Trebouxia sp. C0005]
MMEAYSRSVTSQAALQGIAHVSGRALRERALSQSASTQAAFPVKHSMAHHAGTILYPMPDCWQTCSQTRVQYVQELTCSCFDRSGLGIKTSLTEWPWMTSTAAVQMFQLAGAAAAAIDLAD